MYEYMCKTDIFAFGLTCDQAFFFSVKKLNSEVWKLTSGKKERMIATLLPENTALQGKRIIIFNERGSCQGKNLLS